MKWLIIVLVVLILLVSILYLIGRMMPVKHTARVTQAFKSAPDVIWKIISDPGDYTSWRSGIKKIELIDARTWKETSGHGDNIQFHAEVEQPGRLMVVKIMNTDLPFGGSWTYELTPVAQGTELSITENGEVYNPFFRVMSKYIFGHDTTIKTYMKDLKSKLKE